MFVFFVVLNLLAPGRVCPPSKLHTPRFPSYLQLTYHGPVDRSECAQDLHYFLDLGELRDLEMKARLS